MKFKEFNQGNVKSPVSDLKKSLLKNKQRIHSSSKDEKAVYEIIDNIMQQISNTHGITAKKLHDMWVLKYKKIPDVWIMDK